MTNSINKKRKSLSKGGIYYLVYNVLNLAFPFITGIYVARKLFPADIGNVAAAQNLAQYFVILAFLGIPTYGLREIAKTKDNEFERCKVFSELFIINLISTLVFLSLYIVLILTIKEYRHNLSLYAISGISIALNAFNISWLYEGLEEFGFISLRNLLFKVICFLCLIILVRSPSDYLWYAGITVIGTAGNYIVNMLYAHRLVSFDLYDLNIKRHLKPIFFLVAVNLAIEIYSLMDITMMNFMCSKEHIAFYKYGNSIQKMLLQVVNTFTMVIVPRLSYFYKEKKQDAFNVLLSKGLKLIIITACPMIVGIFFTADFLIQQLYGVQYETAATVLKMLSILLLISPLGYLLGSRTLLVSNNENKMIVCVGAGAIVNFIGNYLLIPTYQEFGATIASIVGEVVVMVIYIQFGRKLYNLVNVKRTVIIVFVACMLMAIYLEICRYYMGSNWINLIVQVTGSVLLYSFMLIITKEEITWQYLSILQGRFCARRSS